MLIDSVEGGFHSRSRRSQFRWMMYHRSILSLEVAENLICVRLEFVHEPLVLEVSPRENSATGPSPSREVSRVTATETMCFYNEEPFKLGDAMYIAYLMLKLWDVVCFGLFWV